MTTNAEDVLAPSGDGVNNTTVLAFTLGVASAAGALPIGWAGKFVRLRPVGGNMWFFFSKNAAATVANPAAAADGGPSITRGEYVPNGERYEVLVPYAVDGTPVYLVRIGDTAATTCYASKASGEPFNNLLNGR